MQKKKQEEFSALASNIKHPVQIVENIYYSGGHFLFRFHHHDSKKTFLHPFLKKKQEIRRPHIRSSGMLLAAVYSE